MIVGEECLIRDFRQIYLLLFFIKINNNRSFLVKIHCLGKFLQILHFARDLSGEPDGSLLESVRKAQGMLLRALYEILDIRTGTLRGQRSKNEKRGCFHDFISVLSLFL